MKIDKVSTVYNLMGVGLGSGICVGISLWIGYSVDNYFSCEPYGILCGIFFGVASSAYYLYEQITKSSKKLDENKKNNEDN